MTEISAPFAALVALLDQSLPGGARLSEDGSLYLQMEGGPSISLGLTPDKSEILFQAALAFLSHPSEVVLMSAALACNFQQADTAGGAIGLDLEALVLNYSRRVPASEAVLQALPDVLEVFCETARSLADRLAEVGAEISAQERDAIDLRLQALAMAHAEAGETPQAAPDAASFA